MKSILPRNKVIFQTRSNIWNNIKIKNLRKKKWKFFLKNLFFYKNSTKKRLKSKSIKYFYKQRLLEKQKIKSFYGYLSNKQLKKYYEIVLKKGDVNIIDNLNIFLEKHLDITLYRLGIVSSVFESKQIILHKKIKVNGNIITYSQYVLKRGDIITISKEIYNTENKYNQLPYILHDLKNQLFVFLRNPKITEIKYPFNYNPELIFELFNK